MDRSEVIPGAGPRSPDTTCLDEWVAVHGPLWPPVALVVALETCASATRLPHVELAAVIGSLNSAGISRNEQGWSWVPRSTGRAAQSISDTEIIERLGGILFHSLAGQALTYPLPDEHVLRTTMRRLRPDLSANLADLNVRAVWARHNTAMTLSSFAADLRQALGVEREFERRRSRRLLKLAGAAALVTLASGLWWMAAPGDTSRLESHGLTSEETVLLDVATEAAETNALIDEHTAAIQHYQEIARSWQARVAPEDPRIAWNLAHEAWVRTLAGDRLTTEQLLNDAPGWMARELGDRHPYTRAVRLGLAATLEARGAPEAASLRGRAEDATQALLQSTGGEPLSVNDVPAPPGVLAHVAPNPPEREGFRHAGESRYFRPLTSMQRWNAGRHGWRLHIVARGTCRASFVTGIEPRLVAVNAMHTADKSWQIRVEGTKPEMTLQAAAGDTAGVSLAADSTGTVLATLGGAKTQSTSIDTTSPPPNPPYTVAFDGPGCSVVWLEIPFPLDAKAAAASLRAPSP